jgi:hypothetical protein
MELKMAFHAFTGRRMVEVFDNTGAFVAAIYPNEEKNGIKIVSKHIATFDLDDGKQSEPPIPAITVDFFREGER